MENETDEEDASVAFRLPCALKEALEAAAKREERTLSGYIRFHLAKIADADPAFVSTKEVGQ